MGGRPSAKRRHGGCVGYLQPVMQNLLHIHAQDNYPTTELGLVHNMMLAPVLRCECLKGDTGIQLILF